MSLVVLGLVPQILHSDDWIAARGTGFVKLARAKILTRGVIGDSKLKE